MRLLAKCLIFCVPVLLSVINAEAQTASAIPLFFEKVYLHTDRDVYTQGEDIWFKAYLVDAQNNKPINYSHNLYVELISPGLKIVTRHVIRLENGLGNGDFKLADTISAGTYRVRAYTNWMRNFGDNFVFEKNITVINTSIGQPGIAAVQLKPIKRFKKNPAPVGKPDTIPSGSLVRFFPEGGSLVDDVTSMVAVKAEDEHGKGIPAVGTVMASSGRVVGRFTCDSLGFGSFSLTPDETQRYHAVVAIKGEPTMFEIRKSRHKGFVMSVNTTDNMILADVSISDRSLSESGGNNVVVVGRHDGKTIYKDKLRVSSNSLLIQIPNTNFPEGIAAITLYDEHSTPLSERLVYIHHPGKVNLTVNTDKAIYQPKEKVSVKIKLDKNEQGSLSFAAVDAGLSPIQPENILSYLNLSSEIKGTIEHPERYFDTTNVNRFKQLDLLLLTQGWRDFVWKKIADTTLKLSYDVEQAIAITGRVRKVWINKAMPNMTITMFAPKAEKDKLFTAVSDSAGRFTIDGAVFYGYQYINFTSRTLAGIDGRGRSKGKSGGYIQVDSLFQNKMAIGPALVNLADTVPLKTDGLIERDKIKQKFNFTGINQLGTVQIKSYSNALPPEIHAITLTEQKEYGSLMQYLVYMIPGARMVFGGCRVGDIASDTSIYEFLRTGVYLPYAHRVSIKGTYTDNSKLDERDYCDLDYLGLPMQQVLKVTINKRETINGIVYSANVEIRPGVLDVKVFDHTMANITGYEKARTFYSPRYETPNTLPDYRTTIHWEPNITTDKNGEATVSYYNADPKSKIRLIVQGITDKGMPVVATTSYLVK